MNDLERARVTRHLAVLVNKELVERYPGYAAVDDTELIEVRLRPHVDFVIDRRDEDERAKRKPKAR